MAQKRTTCTASQAQGIGLMRAEQNKPKFDPKLPGVGFWCVLARWLQSVRGACAGLWATKRTQLWARKVIYYIENIYIYNYARTRYSARHT